MKHKDQIKAFIEDRSITRRFAEKIFQESNEYRLLEAFRALVYDQVSIDYLLVHNSMKKIESLCYLFQYCNIINDIDVVLINVSDILDANIEDSNTNNEFANEYLQRLSVFCNKVVHSKKSEISSNLNFSASYFDVLLYIDKLNEFIQDQKKQLRKEKFKNFNVSHVTEFLSRVDENYATLYQKSLSDQGPMLGK